MVGLLDALGEEQAVIAGHDWGAPVAWHAALLRPDRFRGVIGLSVPFRPRGPVRPTTVMPQTDDAVFYQLYFQTPGVAEAEFERDVRAVFIRGILFIEFRRQAAAKRPRRPRSAWCRGGRSCRPHGRRAGHSGDAAALAHRGRCRFLRGRIRAHRVSRRAQLVPQHRPQLGAAGAVRRSEGDRPALYIAGDRDLVMAFRGMDQLIAEPHAFRAATARTIMLPGCGHWTQQERPAEVNAAMIEFLRSL